MANPKPKQDTTASITLSAKTAAKIESKLRAALVNAGSTNIVADPVRRKGKIKVPLDPATVARFTEHLRRGLVASESTNISEAKAADKATSRIKSFVKKP